MYKLLYFFLILFFSTGLTAGSKAQTFASKTDSIQKTYTINSLDTVVFDLSQADTSSNYVEFPVFILSDDTVNALDFSFKYNEVDFTYDSILDLTTYMQTFSYYNPFDSTLRFTSNSFQRYENDSALLVIRFSVLSGQFCDNDLRSVKAYLNGDVCTVKIVDCLHLDVAKLYNKEDEIRIYPNPSDNIFNILFTENAMLELFMMDGSKILTSILKANQNQEISTLPFSNGIYLIHLFGEKFSYTKKIIIQH